MSMPNALWMVALLVLACIVAAEAVMIISWLVTGGALLWWVPS